MECSTGNSVTSNVTIRVLENGGLVEQRHYKNSITELFAKGLAAFTGGMFRTSGAGGRTASYTPMSIGVGDVGIIQPTTPEETGSFESTLVYRNDAYPDTARLITFQDKKLRRELLPAPGSELVNLRAKIGAAPAVTGRKQANTYGVILTALFAPGVLNRALPVTVDLETGVETLLPVGISEFGLYPATRQGETLMNMMSEELHPNDLLAGVALTPDATLPDPTTFTDPELYKAAWDVWNATPPKFILLKPNQALEISWFIGFFPSSLYEFGGSIHNELMHTKVNDDVYYKYPR